MSELTDLLEDALEDDWTPESDAQASDMLHNDISISSATGVEDRKEVAKKASNLGLGVHHMNRVEEFFVINERGMDFLVEERRGNMEQLTAGILGY